MSNGFNVNFGSNIGEIQFSRDGDRAAVSLMKAGNQGNNQDAGIYVFDFDPAISRPPLVHPQKRKVLTKAKDHPNPAMLD